MSHVTNAALSTLNHPRYQLREEIPVQVQWEEEMQCYVAYDHLFDWYGTGDSPNDAVRHLAEVLLEDYQDLNEMEGDLSPELQGKLSEMRRYILDAG